MYFLCEPTAEPVDISLLLPDVATIGQTKLQCYCDEWLQRPIAREFGIVQLNVRLVDGSAARPGRAKAVATKIAGNGKYNASLVDV
jgi:hypothetical protein